MKPNDPKILITYGLSCLNHTLSTHVDPLRDQFLSRTCNLSKKTYPNTQLISSNNLQTYLYKLKKNNPQKQMFIHWS